jgi:mannan endo-1,4-beta-mannosidase
VVSLGSGKFVALTKPHGVDAVSAWVGDMSFYLKSLDTNHMVSVGEEGWRAIESWEGTRWELNNASPYLDYCVIHCWPDQWTWLWKTHPGTLHSNAMNWVVQHLAYAQNTLRKPFVMSEYGKARPLAGPYGRDAYYADWFQILYDSAATDGAAATTETRHSTASEGRFIWVLLPR